jgi:E3 ubiquitin-protein ligase HERC2
VALACDLGLDSLLQHGVYTAGDPHKWVWFRRYCIASRVAMALQHRGAAASTPQLPTVFRDDVFKKVQEVSADDERVDREHENHELFGREQDEQLLLWINRFLLCTLFLTRPRLLFKHMLAKKLDLYK